MRKHTRFLMENFARFRVLSTDLLRSLGHDRYGRTVLSRNMNELMRENFVIKTVHPIARTNVYIATEKLFQVVYGPEAELPPAFRMSDVYHTLQVSEALLALVRYPFVTGVAAEHELSTKDADRFAFERRPDGIVQITKDGQSYEYAVEIEASSRNSDRIAKVLAAYQQTLKMRDKRCEGIIIVATHDGAFKEYERQLAEGPSSFRACTVLRSSTGLIDLHPNYFGVRESLHSKRCQITVKRVRSEATGGIRYVPL